MLTPDRMLTPKMSSEVKLVSPGSAAEGGGDTSCHFESDDSLSEVRQPSDACSHSLRRGTPRNLSE